MGGSLENDQAWLGALHSRLVSALNLVGFQNVGFIPTLSLKAGDLFEPDALPWRVRVGNQDMPINFPLPGPPERKPWGVVTRVELRRYYLQCQWLHPRKGCEKAPAEKHTHVATGPGNSTLRRSAE